MAYQSEIEKLESRFREKPEQWFAALADAYRKAGDLDMALDVLNAWIGKRPNYTSGHIVLGRCLLDRGQDADAAEAFENVLQLDMENVIALKSLSEIAARRADPDGAKRWLQRLLEVDPMNEEARAALDQLGGEGVGPEAKHEGPAALELVVERAPSFELEEPEPLMEGLEPTALELERASEPPAMPMGFEPTSTEAREGLDTAVDADGTEAELPDIEVEPVFLDTEETGTAADREEPPFIMPVSELEAVDEPGEPEEMLAEGAFEPAEFTGPDADAPAVAPVEGLTVADAPFSLRTDGEEASEVTSEPMEPAAPKPQDADVAPVEGLTLGGAPFTDEPEVGERVYEIEFVQPPAADPQPEPMAEAVPAAPDKEVEELPLILPEEVSADLDEPAIREPEPVVTETMAELYASQGLYAEARDIYRELLDQDPHDARLRERLEELEDEYAGRPAAEEGSSRRGYAASATGGVSVGSMLRELLGGPVAGPAPSSGRDHSEGAPPGGAVPSSPAVPDSPEKTDEGFSFDEFFGVPKPGTDEPRESDDDDEPEDGFRDWLKGLKK
ncbi:MAG: tetratricopeptide repeat protein [Gemmatimonadota bacterium]|nr:tetratricopeptide repeat protein [Gemmatimonadota bacterium]MDH3479735.1 tetratricopeptide repeat protein [Gemmatimonadota bacterium]MDH3569251.1 tetratricopeptide repeat protein [Gemmatimonadota bacterium]MDH5549474.1 tetratricopeptide repeat protein [Gemmatimonadota bacterium]